MEHERAMYTGLFAVRNFLVEKINAIEPQHITSTDLSALEVAHDNLSRLMDKSSPRGQAFLMVLFDLSLSFENLIVTVRRTLTNGKSDTVELALG